jgi:hypothetical protein
MNSDAVDRQSKPAGLPHSVTPGSMDVCSSPGLFAAYRDLLRQAAPRHPPWTLVRLTILPLYPSLCCKRSCGGMGIRTPDLWLAKPPLWPAELYPPVIGMPSMRLLMKQAKGGEGTCTIAPVKDRRRSLSLRKEVIQPHLPVRLPCYDFTPLTRHTFGTAPLCRSGKRLRVPPTRVV